MPVPDTHNLRIDKGTDFSRVFTLKDSAGDAFDLTGYTVAAEAEDRTATVLGASNLDLSPSVTGAVTGEITLSVTDTTTAAISGVTEGLRDDEKPIYDLLITKTSTGLTTKVAEGIVEVVATTTTGT